MEQGKNKSTHENKINFGPDNILLRSLKEASVLAFLQIHNSQHLWSRQQRLQM